MKDGFIDYSSKNANGFLCDLGTMNYEFHECKYALISTLSMKMKRKTKKIFFMDNRLNRPGKREEGHTTPSIDKILLRKGLSRILSGNGLFSTHPFIKIGEGAVFKRLLS